MAKSATPKAKPQAPREAAKTQAPFFKRPTPVNLARHETAGLRKTTSFDFARGTNAMLVSLQEIAEAARSYPLVFGNGEQPKLLAILGTENRNLFIEPDGSWRRGHYVPSYVRKYPFAVASQPDGSLMLCVDEAAENFAGEHPDLPFFVQGEASELCRQALQMNALFSKQLDATEAFCRAVKEADLLEEARLEITTKDAQKHVLGGFSILKESRWNTYSKNHIMTWHEKGYDALVVLILASQLNWKYLV